LVGVSLNHSRQACSVWLVTSAARCTRGEAATLLGTPERSGPTMAKKIVFLINAMGRAERFDVRTRSVACSVAAHDGFVDYMRWCETPRALLTFSGSSGDPFAVAPVSTLASEVDAAARLHRGCGSITHGETICCLPPSWCMAQSLIGSPLSAGLPPRPPCRARTAQRLYLRRRSVTIGL
jgi:hypothetical protein